LRYDPSKAAVFHPELQPPLAMDSGWPLDAIYAEFCRLAYFRFESGAQAGDVITRAVGRIGYRDLGFFDDGRDAGDRSHFDAQGFGAINEQGAAVIAFRGTQPDSLHDILVDVSILPVRWQGNAWVHSGFRKALESILPGIEEWVGRRQINNLVIAGHSLGAALATLLAGKLTHAELVTFGSPRVGNEAFARSFDGRAMRRYVNCIDIVTSLPIAPYVHLGGRRYIDPDGGIHETESAVSLRDRIKANLDYRRYAGADDNAPLRGLADHAPVNYIASLLGGRVGPGPA
jgi:hypothetical protein